MCCAVRVHLRRFGNGMYSHKSSGRTTALSLTRKQPKHNVDQTNKKNLQLYIIQHLLFYSQDATRTHDTCRQESAERILTVHSCISCSLVASLMTRMFSLRADSCCCCFSFSSESFSPGTSLAEAVYDKQHGSVW